QEESGENPRRLLIFVRRGVCCCSAVALRVSRVTVALLGRFLPRLGPPANCGRPFFFPSADAALAAVKPYSSAAREGRNSSNGISDNRSAKSSNSAASLANEAERS